MGGRVRRIETEVTIPRCKKEQVTNMSGGFYSAEDADSKVNKHTETPMEGLFYLWEFNVLSDFSTFHFFSHT